jgi:hypothetical protein
MIPDVVGGIAMSIRFACSSCGARLRIAGAAVDRTIQCPSCFAKTRVPADTEAGEAYPVQEEPPQESEPDPTPRRAPQPRPIEESLPPLSTEEPPLWLRHLHWLLVLALIPLGVSLLKQKDEGEFKDRLLETIRQSPPAAQREIIGTLDNIEKGHATFDDLFRAMPGHKFVGAFLSRDSSMHWAFGLAAAVLFMAFIALLGSQDIAQPLHLLAVGLFTATAGIIFLLIVQWLADAS